MKYTLRPPALKPIAGARHAADAPCPDAAWKRLTRNQKAGLSILARRAYDHQRVTGSTPDQWRHEQAIRACGLRISEATQQHWADLKSAFQILAGEDGKAFQTQVREGDNKRRIAMYKLTQACRERGLHPSYPAAICHTQFKVPLAEASAKQLWCLFYTITNRRKPTPSV
jgi:hypothetical protein